jgi:hypothetical protein
MCDPQSLPSPPNCRGPFLPGQFSFPAPPLRVTFAVPRAEIGIVPFAKFDYGLPQNGLRFSGMQGCHLRSTRARNEPGKVAVSVVQAIVRIGVACALALAAGCAHNPWSARKMRQGAPLAQARAIGLASRAPDSRALPALVGQLDNTDPVVRLAAYEELRRRTGQDFGYVPWAQPEEQSDAVERWRAWAGQDGLPSAQALQTTVYPASPGKSLPSASGMTPTS